MTGVYLCDDVPELRALLRMTLEEDPCLEVVGESGDIPTAISEIEELQPTVVLLDLSMPGMDGLEGLPEIERVSPETGIIVFSGFIASRLAHVAMDRGADRYVEKGTPLRDLRDMVVELADEIRENAAAA